jgi:hypothetical protein
MRDMCEFINQPAGSWINTIEDAPAFRPTAAEWADPVGYIRSIQGRIRDHGIARIVPPILPGVPGPLVLSQRANWRYSVRQQHLGGAAWRTFDDAHALIFDSHK